MIKFLADENFDNAIMRGVLRHNQSVDLVRVQDVGLSGEEDPIILEWAAQEGRILLTHDVSTITRYAYERLAENLPMPGVIEVSTEVPIGEAIKDILLIDQCGVPKDLEGQIYYLPL